MQATTPKYNVVMYTYRQLIFRHRQILHDEEGTEHLPITGETEQLIILLVHYAKRHIQQIWVVPQCLERSLTRGFSYKKNK